MLSSPFLAQLPTHFLSSPPLKRVTLEGLCGQRGSWSESFLDPSPGCCVALGSKPRSEERGGSHRKTKGCSGGRQDEGGETGRGSGVEEKETRERGRKREEK